MDSWADPDWRSEPLCRGGAINTDPGQPDRKDAFHAGMAVTIDPDGCLNDVDLGDPDLRLEHLRRLIGCAAVHPIPLAADLLIWIADRTDGFSLNVAATDLVMITEHPEPDHRDHCLHR